MRQERELDAERRERLIYNRPYNLKDYGEDGYNLSRFKKLPIAVVKQLVAEGLLSLEDGHNDSPTVGEMLAFCSGADEDIWFFHGFTVGPERIDCRVTLEGFESCTAPTPERIEEFLRFNRHGEKQRFQRMEPAGAGMIEVRYTDIGGDFNDKRTSDEHDIRSA